MKSVILRSVVTVMTFGMPTVPTIAESLLWKVSSEDCHLYLGGTIHMLASADYPLPSVFGLAYEGSEDLVLETDLGEMYTPEFQKAVTMLLSYSDGQTLRDNIRPETYAALEKHLATRGATMARFETYKPAMVSLAVTLLEMGRLELTGEGVDAFFWKQALADQRDVLGLETSDEQLAFLGSMGKGREDELIVRTLEDVNEIPVLLKAMKDAWRTGDVLAMEKVALNPFREEYPELFESLVVTRNNDWMPKIEALLDTDEVELVLVGALHLIGEQGLVNQLRERGCTVEQVVPWPVLEDSSGVPETPADEEAGL